jgi:hypothetical protein
VSVSLLAHDLRVGVQWPFLRALNQQHRRSFERHMCRRRLHYSLPAPSRPVIVAESACSCCLHVCRWASRGPRSPRQGDLFQRQGCAATTWSRARSQARKQAQAQALAQALAQARIAGCSGCRILGIGGAPACPTQSLRAHSRAAAVTRRRRMVIIMLILIILLIHGPTILIMAQKLAFGSRIVDLDRLRINFMAKSILSNVGISEGWYL